MHANLPFLLGVIAAIVLLNMWASRLRVAYPILLVIGGLLISFIPRLPMIRINPDLIFFLVMPPLLFEASWTISYKEMRRWWRIIGSFAFLVVFFTAITVAVFVNRLIPGFSIGLGFVLGGIVAPPDAVSTGAITRFVTIPKSTSAILEGESLLNDASSASDGCAVEYYVDADRALLYVLDRGANPLFGCAGSGERGFVHVHKAVAIPE